TARKAGGPFTQCQPPGYTDPATNACIFDATKGAEAKARASIGKGCTKDCPTCYSASGNCPNGAAFVTSNESNVDVVGPLVYCLEAAGTNPSKTEAKCEDTVAKTLVKFVGSKGKCYEKCITNEFNGKIPSGSCLQPTPSDAATQACLSKATTKSAAT